MAMTMLIYFEMGHSRLQSIGAHLQKELSNLDSEHLEKTAVLLETSPRSVQFQALEWLLNGLVARKLLPRYFYEDFASTARDYTREQFLRQIEIVKIATQKSKEIPIIHGVDPRGSPNALAKFRTSDPIYPKLIKKQPHLPRIWIKDELGLYNGCLPHRTRNLFSKEFLEEQAFCAWTIATKVSRLEVDGIKTIILMIGALHFPALIKYLKNSSRELKLFRLPVDSDPAFRNINLSRACLEQFFLIPSRNPDYLSLFNFFINPETI
jgi:hypothetical protein